MLRTTILANSNELENIEESHFTDKHCNCSMDIC